MSCKICASAELEPVFDNTLEASEWILAGVKYGYVLCKSCGFLQCDPIPDEATLLKFYQEKYPYEWFQKNEYFKNLNEKLEKKAFETAKQYHMLADYRLEYNVALKALENFIVDYPGTPYKEEAMFYRLDSAYKMAMNSVPQKKEERLNYAKTTYTSLVKFKPDSEFKGKADEILASIEKELQQYTNSN